VFAPAAPVWKSAHTRTRSLSPLTVVTGPTTASSVPAFMDTTVAAPVAIAELAAVPTNLNAAVIDRCASIARSAIVRRSMPCSRMLLSFTTPFAVALFHDVALAL
jgi:hypothetical protein